MSGCWVSPSVSFSAATLNTDLGKQRQWTHGQCHCKPTEQTTNKGLLETEGSVVLNLNQLRNYGSRKSIQKYNFISKHTGLFSILFLSQLPIRIHYLWGPGNVLGVPSGYFHVLGVWLALFCLCDSPLFQFLLQELFQSVFLQGLGLLYSRLTVLTKFEIGCPSTYTLGSSGRENRTRRALLLYRLGVDPSLSQLFLPHRRGVPDSGKITAQLGPKLLRWFAFCFYFCRQGFSV